MNLRDVDGASIASEATEIPQKLRESISCRIPWCQFGLPREFEWNIFELPIHGLSPGLTGRRIVHLSDLHLKAGWSSGYDALISKLRENPPDVLFITGDFVEDKIDPRSAWPTLERFASQLNAKFGIFAVAGNHDGDLIAPRLSALGVTIIEREFIVSKIEENLIEIAGLPGVKRRDFEPSEMESLPPRTPGRPRFILGHFPDQVRFVAPAKADSMFVGHTHGGQICLPNGYAPLTHDRLPHRMARGIHRFNETLLFVNRGFGTGKWPIRIFCPPEVIEVRLTAR